MSRSSVALMLFILALLTAPFASAATGPSKQEVRAMMLRGQALNELYNVAPSTPVTLMLMTAQSGTTFENASQALAPSPNAAAR